MMKNILKTICHITFLVIATLTSSTYAAESKASTLLYISPNEYEHSVIILTPYSEGYWFKQGPLVEPIIFEALKAKDSNVTVCRGGETADTIVRVKPYMFYNPMAGLYYAKLVSTVYSADGEIMGAYTGEATKRGPGPAILEMTAAIDINKAYALAMKDLMTKLQIKPIAERKKVITVLPCGIIGSQSEARFTFN